MSYVTPEPTPEMVELACRKKFDANNTLGTLPIWELRRDDTLAAAGLIHDLMYIRGGNKADYKTYDSNFERDALILAEAVDFSLQELFETSKAKLFADLVYLFGREYWHEENWYTEITWQQAKHQVRDAQVWINTRATKIGQPWPYSIPLL